MVTSSNTVLLRSPNPRSPSTISLSLFVTVWALDPILLSIALVAGSAIGSWSHYKPWPCRKYFFTLTCVQWFLPVTAAMLVLNITGEWHRPLNPHRLYLAARLTEAPNIHDRSETSERFQYGQCLTYSRAPDKGMGRLDVNILLAWGLLCRLHIKLH